MTAVKARPTEAVGYVRVSTESSHGRHPPGGPEIRERLGLGLECRACSAHPGPRPRAAGHPAAWRRITND